MCHIDTKQYNIINPKDESCSFCEKLTKIYNLESSGYEFEINKEVGRGYLRQIASYENVQIIDFKASFHKQLKLQGISRTPHIDMFFCIGDDIEWGFQGKRNQFEI